MPEILESAQKLELSFDGDLPTVEGILALVQEWAQQVGASYDDRLSLRLILEELLTNICLHGSESTEVPKIRLYIEPLKKTKKKEFLVKIWDSGRAFNPLQHDDVAVDGIQNTPIGQRGLSLVRLLTDDASYSYKDGNVFSFIFSLDAEHVQPYLSKAEPFLAPFRSSIVGGLKFLWKNNIAFRQTVLFTLCAFLLIWCAMGAFYFGTARMLRDNTGSLAMQAMYTQSVVNSSFLKRIELNLNQVVTTLDSLRITPQSKLFLQNAQALYNFLQYDISIGVVAAEIPVLGIMAGVGDKAWFFHIVNGTITNRYTIKDLRQYMNTEPEDNKWQALLLSFETFGKPKDEAVTDPHAPIMYSKAISTNRDEGWIGVVVTMPWIAESLKKLSGFSSAVPLLFDTTGQYVIFPPGRSLLHGPQSFAEEAKLSKNPALAKLEEAIITGQKDTVQLRSIFESDATPWDLPWKGPTSLVYYPMEIPGWHLALLVDSYELGNAPTPFPRYFLVVALLGPLCIGFITWLVTSRTLRPLHALNASIRKLSEGDTDSPFPPSTFPDEVGSMLTAFNRVRVTLRTSFRNLVFNTTKQQRLLNELAIARNTQESMLPHTLPKIDGIELAASLDMASEVCGDLYSCFVNPKSPELVHFVMGDVCGKGIPAALIMSRAVALARAFLMEEGNPAITLGRVNEALLRNDSSSMFVTMLVASFDTQTGAFVWASAGHPPPLWTGVTGQELVPWSNELVLNVRKGQSYTNFTLNLAEGGAIVLYTDGASEAISPPNREEGEIFGEERLQESFIKAWQKNAHAENILQDIREDLFKHMQGLDASDDISLLLISRNG